MIKYPVSCPRDYKSEVVQHIYMLLSSVAITLPLLALLLI